MLVLTNVLLLLWFGFAAYSALRFAGLPIISIIYLLFAIIMLGLILRKHLCTHCYYYKKLCGTGWGKLSSCLFKEKSGNYWNETRWLNLGIVDNRSTHRHSRCDVSARGIFSARWNKSNRLHGDNGRESVREKNVQCKMRYICKASAEVMDHEGKTSKNSEDSIREI